MAKRSHSLAMADAMTSPLTPPDPAVNSKDSQYHSLLSSPPGNTGLSRSKHCRGPGGSCHQPMHWHPGQQWICGLTGIPIKSPSSESGWSTLPQVQSVKDTSEGDSQGMTLKLGVGPDTHCSSEYSRRRPTQDEMLVGCGAWQHHQLETEMVPSMPFEEALAHELPKPDQRDNCNKRHSDGKSQINKGYCPSLPGSYSDP